MIPMTENVTSPQHSLQSPHAPLPGGYVGPAPFLTLPLPGKPFPSFPTSRLPHSSTRCTTSAQGRLLHYCPAVRPSEAFHPGGLAHGPSLHPHVPADSRCPFGAAALHMCMNQSVALDGAILSTSSKPGPLPKHKADLKFLTLRSEQT